MPVEWERISASRLPVKDGNYSFMGKNKSKALDAKLASATKWIGAAFLILTFVLNLF